MENEEKMLKAVQALENNKFIEAHKLTEELAEEGYADAEHAMGWFYEQGIGVQKSDEKAFYWWSKSAPKGIMESEGALGGMYQEGRGTTKDIEKAYYWHSIAYKNGYSWSRHNIKDLEKELTKEQVNDINEKIKLKT